MSASPGPIVGGRGKEQHRDPLEVPLAILPGEPMDPPWTDQDILSSNVTTMKDADLAESLLFLFPATTVRRDQEFPTRPQTDREDGDHEECGSKP